MEVLFTAAMRWIQPNLKFILNHGQEEEETVGGWVAQEKTDQVKQEERNNGGGLSLLAASLCGFNTHICICIYSLKEINIDLLAQPERN